MPFRLVLIATILYVLVLLTATHIPPSALPTTHVSDKIEHFFAYFTLGALVSVAVALKLGRTAALAVLLALSLFGALDEITQPLTGRSCDILDWSADTAGITAAAACVTVGLRLHERRRRTTLQSVAV